MRWSKWQAAFTRGGFDVESEDRRRELAEAQAKDWVRDASLTAIRARRDRDPEFARLLRDVARDG